MQGDREDVGGLEPEDRHAAEGRHALVGRTLAGKYRIEEQIAEGGMGRVYRATQLPLGRSVAVKVLARAHRDAEFSHRFTLEAATAAKLTHPHTVTVFDYGETEDGDLFLVMEHLRGRTLARVLYEEGPFDAARALRVGLQICRAVREAHALGVVHRDLKPGNVFLVEEGDDGDHAKVLDFGLAKLFRQEPAEDESGDLEVTRTNALVGSPRYMSPEQIQGHRLDPRSDVYAFGVVLFEMLAGRPPYEGATAVDVLYQHVHAPIPRVSEVACPLPVAAILERCLAKRPEDRFASMDELVLLMKEALRMITGVAVSADSVAEDESPFTPEITRADPPRRSSSRPASTPPGPSRQGTFALVASVVAALVVALLWARSATLSPAAPAAIADASVELRTAPPGARVFEGKRLLGVTPLATHLSAPEHHELAFVLAGYERAVRALDLDGRSVVVDVELAPKAAEAERSDYRDNPY